MRHCFEQKYFRNWKIKFSWKLLKQEPSRGSSFLPKGGLISEGILTLIPLPKRGAKCLPWGGILKKLFTVKFGLSETHTKFEKIFLMVLTNLLIYLVNVKTMAKRTSVQWRDVAPFVGNGTKVKIPSEIKLPLRTPLPPIYISK